MGINWLQIRWVVGYQLLSGAFWGSLLRRWSLSDIFNSGGLQWLFLLVQGKVMTSSGITDLVVQLEEALDLSEMEQEVKLVVSDENVAKRILDQVPWGIMKKNLSVKKWFLHLALEEIVMELVPFWIQIRGMPLGLSTLANVKKLTQAAGEVLDLEDTAKARGFLRVRILVNTVNPLCIGCWLRWGSTRDTWVEFCYERLQDFCYRCGRIDHINTECTFEVDSSGAAGYGEWTKAQPIREELVPSRPLAMGVGERRQAGTARDYALPTSHRHETGPSKNLPNNQIAQEVSIISQLASDEPGILPRVEGWDFTPSGEFLRTGAIMDPTYAERSGLKRGGRFQRWEFLHNPLKKARGLEFLSNHSAVLEETWLGRNLPERCLMIERAVYTEGETMEGSSGSQRMGVCLEEVCEDAHVKDMQSDSSTQARGGGGWPLTAARSP
ncbi:hypothetical protein ACFX2F_034086 [Malus domestica]